MKLKSLLILFSMLLLFACNSQSQIKTPSNIGLKTTSKNSIIQYDAGDVVTDGFVDRSGNVWFATTKEGLFKYDGKNFINITEKEGLCSNEVWSVIQDDNGLLWFGTAKGLCRYDGNNFVNILIPQEDLPNVSPETGFPSRLTQGVTSLTQDSNGDFWVGTNARGAYRYDGMSFTSFLKFEGRLHPVDSVYNNCITSIIEDSKGNIWFSSMTHGGISRYDGESIRNFTTEDGLLGDMIKSSFEDKSGKIWFGSIQNLNGGLMCYDGESFKSYTTEDGLCDSNVTYFYEDDSGKIWIGTGDGVCYYEGGTFTEFNNNGQSLGDIRFIIKDNNGDMWMGGRYGSLWKYDGEELTDYTYKKYTGL